MVYPIGASAFEMHLTQGWLTPVRKTGEVSTSTRSVGGSAGFAEDELGAGHREEVAVRLRDKVEKLLYL